MKKLVAVILTMIVLIPAVFAETGAGATYEQLVAARDALNKIIWESYTWREIIIKSGQYVVGVDFPAGTYRLTAQSGQRPLIAVETVEGDTIDMYAHRLSLEWVEPRHNEITVYTFVDGQFLDVSLGAFTVIFDNYVPGFSAFADDRKENPLPVFTELHEKLLERIKALPIWEDVVVYPGTWAVGTQIPVGRWSIFPSNRALCGVHYSHYIHDDGTIYNNAIDVAIKSPQRGTYDPYTDIPYVSIDAREGYYIKIDDSSVIFTPYVGKPLFIFLAE